MICCCNNLFDPVLRTMRTRVRIIKMEAFSAHKMIKRYFLTHILQNCPFKLPHFCCAFLPVALLGQPKYVRKKASRQTQRLYRVLCRTAKEISVWHLILWSFLPHGMRCLMLLRAQNERFADVTLMWVLQKWRPSTCHRRNDSGCMDNILCRQVPWGSRATWLGIF